MALQRTLDMLQAGERINDRLYAATVDTDAQATARSTGRRWTYRPMSGRIRSLLRRTIRPEPIAWPLMIPRGAFPPGNGW
jgi:hypothetical protein